MLNILKKYFIPNEENEYKPHLLRRTSVAVISFISVLVFFFGILHVVVIENTSLLSAVISRALVELANNNRVQNNLTHLATSPVLEEAAQLKANDMAAKSYFAHVSPEGTTPWYWFKEAGYDFQYAGENLAVNFSDSYDVDRAWMNSPSHRANILNGKFTEIGIATAKGYYNGQETIFVVQMFGKPLRNNLANIANTVVGTQTANAQIPAPTTSPVQSPQNPVVAKPTPTSTPATGPVLAAEAEGNSGTGANPISGTAETYIEIENVADVPEGNQVAAVSVKTNDDASKADVILSSPKKTVSLIYSVISVIIFIAIVLMIFIEIKRQHPKHIGLGVLVLALICALGYVFREILFTGVAVI